MKNTLSIIGQFLLFFLVDALGSIFYHPFRVTTKAPGTDAVARTFQWDGLLLMALVYLLVLLIEALRKRLRSSAPWSSLAILLAALAGYLLKFGFMTHKW